MSDSREESRKRYYERVAQEDRKKCEGKTYELFGVSNFFDIIPDFVVPVFTCKEEGDDKKYIQEGEKDHINNFAELNNYPIIPLAEILTNDINFPLFTVDSKALYAFQTAENEYFIGYSDQLKEFLSKFRTDDEILREQITEFADEFS